MTTLFALTMKNTRYWRWTLGDLHRHFSHHLHPLYPIVQISSSTSVLTLSRHVYTASNQAYGSPCFLSFLSCHSSSSKRKYSTFNVSLAVSQPVIMERKYFHHHGNKLTSSSTGQSHSKTKVQELVKEILRATREIDVMTDSLSEEAVTNLVVKLKAQGFNSGKICKLLSERLWLLEQPDPTINLTQLLLLHDFPYPMVCQLIEAIPYNLQNSLAQLPDKVNSMIFFLGSQGISVQDAISVLSLSPDMLYLDLKSVGKALSQLKSIFSSKDITKLLKKSPSLLVNNWTESRQKYEYAIYSMVYSNQDIIHSSFFSHTLEHIRNRHIFLARSGLFVDVSPKLDPALNPNPKLRDIVDTSDVNFLKLFPVTDLTGYQVFCEMTALEQEMEDEDLDEFTDEDSDTEKDNSDKETFIEFSKQKPSSKKKHANKSRLKYKQGQR